MSQSVIQRLAERIRSFGDKNVTKQAIELSRTAIIDTIGVTLAGSVEPCAANLLRTPGIAEAPGPCTLFGTNRKTSALDATFFNGTASHALDYDDFSQPMGGHQSAPLVAPLVAVAEERGLAGAQLIQSYVLGIETEIRLARAVNFHHYDKGWHPTATVGVFGAAAAVGHLIGLDEERLTVALAIAASFASGVKANFGTMVKPLHVGQSARNGLLAILLAEPATMPTRPCSSTSKGSSTPLTAPATMTPTRSSTTGPTRWRSPARPWASSSFPAAAAPTRPSL